jgi:hypothetical protein
MASEEILTKGEKEWIKAAVFTEYQRRWGKISGPEHLIVVRTIEAFNVVLDETARLQA